MKLEEIRTLCDEATMGPWTWRVADGICNKYMEEGAIVVDREECERMTPANCRFIAAARDLLPKLLKVAEAAEGIPVPNDLKYAEPEVRALAEALAALEAD